MIPRSQRVLFWILLGVSLAMAVVVIRLREQAADRLAGQLDTTQEAPALAAPTAAPSETVTLQEASDLNGSVAPVTREIPLPQEQGARARVLLRQLFADYAAPQSRHPLVAGTGVENVFFMPDSATDSSSAPTAVVNLTAALADNHPSGIEPETLTLLSIIGTLHENFPAVQQVRFLVDGQPRDTLAGHADLTRAYLTTPNGSHP